jgi:hypothetical protein
MLTRALGAKAQGSVAGKSCQGAPLLQSDELKLDHCPPDTRSALTFINTTKGAEFKNNNCRMACVVGARPAKLSEHHSMEPRMELNRQTRSALSRSLVYGNEKDDVEHCLWTSKAHSSDIDARVARARAAAASPRDVKLRELTGLSLSPLVRSVQNWWLRRTERHYLICADVELQRAREAQMNVAYYQKRAAMARSART